MENPSYFSILTAEVRYDERLSSLQKLLFSEITALSNKTGECWASNSYFAKLYKVSETWVSLSIKKLVDYGYIESRIAVNEGNTRYLSLTTVKDPLKLELNSYLTTVKDPSLTTVKENNIKVNNKKNNKVNIETLSQKKFSKKEDITESVISDLASKYDCPESFVYSCWDSAINWMDANGKTKKNYKAFLDNWVKSEVVKVKSFKKGASNGVRIARHEDYRS
jgi:hypothetical protein